MAGKKMGGKKMGGKKMGRDSSISTAAYKNSCLINERIDSLNTKDALIFTHSFGEKPFKSLLAIGLFSYRFVVIMEYLYTASANVNVIECVVIFHESPRGKEFLKNLI